jgi:hypothetical protein
MKLGFVIPLKSSRVSRDWLAVTCCLEGTLRSLGRQSSTDWIAVVVGHEKPDLDWNGFPPNSLWDTANFDLPPIRSGGTFFKYSDFDYLLDKERKIAQGMRHLRDHDVTYWHVLDADDLLHVDFVYILSTLPIQAGWLLQSGYLWYQDIRRWMPSDRLINLCGSTTLIHSSLFDVPVSDHDGARSQIPWMRFSHSEMLTFLQPHLAGANPWFPLRALAYTLSHGDNCSDELRTSISARFKLWVKKTVQTRPLNNEFSNMFGVRFF